MIKLTASEKRVISKTKTKLPVPLSCNSKREINGEKCTVRD